MPADARVGELDGDGVGLAIVEAALESAGASSGSCRLRVCCHRALKYDRIVRRLILFASLLLVSVALFLGGYAASERSPVAHPAATKYGSPETTAGSQGALSISLVVLSVIGFFAFALLGVIAEVREQRVRTKALDFDEPMNVETGDSIRGETPKLAHP